MDSPNFNKWSQSIQLQHNHEFENELYIACILLQGAAEGIAERGTERHNLNSIYWNDTHETISFAALGNELGCTHTTGIVLSNPLFWESFDEFVITGNIQPLEDFEEKLLEFYPVLSTFNKLLNPDAAQQLVETAQQTDTQEAEQQLQQSETVTQEAEQQPTETVQPKKRSFNHTKRIHGRRAITPIRSGRHKTPKNLKNKNK